MKSSSNRLARLEALARGQCIRVLYSRHLQRGGHCWVRGKPVVLLASGLSASEKADLLEHSLLRLEPGLASLLQARATQAEGCGPAGPCEAP